MNRPSPQLLAQRELLHQRYLNVYSVPELGHGTVRDYCDSCDHLSMLSNLQGDLKDLQRPWTLKAILGLCPPGARLLEIGAGEPTVAQMLTELGYHVTVVDPYDGSGHGPTEYEEYRRRFPALDIRRARFSNRLQDLEAGSFDCIYSISVLEHIPEPELSEVFAGIHAFLKKGAHSLHSIDHVLVGKDADYHEHHLIQILCHQSALAGDSVVRTLDQYAKSMRQLLEDTDTYYLSASGHNLWRQSLPYDQFPYRKVVSIQSCKSLLGV